MHRSTRMIFILIAVAVFGLIALSAFVVLSPRDNANIVEAKPTLPILLPTPTPDNMVTLTAKPWNNGMVHLWAFVAEGDVPHKDLPAGTLCRKDSAGHVLGSGTTAIRFYKLNCNGVKGFVEVDQVR